MAFSGLRGACDIPFGIHPEHHQAESFDRVLGEPPNKSAVLVVVRQREPILGVRVVHPLYEFAECTKEVVDLLRLASHLALGLD